MSRINTRQRADMTPEQYDVFRAEMKRLRKVNKLSAKALGEILDCSQTHIYNVERGNRYPSPQLAQDIADVFSLSVDDMLVPVNERKFKQFERTGKEYRNKRNERGYSTIEVAGFLGITKEVYREFENGKCNIGESCMGALDRLYNDSVRVEPVEVIKEVMAPSPISMKAIDDILLHISDMDMAKDEQRALFRELSDAKTSMLEAELFG